MSPDIKKIAHRISRVGKIITVFDSGFRIEAYVDQDTFRVGSVVDLSSGRRISSNDLLKILQPDGWEKLRHRIENAAMVNITNI